MPAYVVEEQQRFRPEGLFWIHQDGAILNFTTAGPGELLSVACDSLAETIKNPQWGSPHSPTQIRVADEALAEALRLGFPRINVICAPTPEVDEIVPQLKQALDSAEPDGPTTLLGLGIDTDMVAAFFQAAAELYRAQPWQIFPDDQSLVSVTIDTLDIQDAVISVIGQMGESFGMIVFHSQADFEQFAEAGLELERGEEPNMPTHMSLNFDRGAEIPEDRRKEITAHQWEVASQDAYPWIGILEEDFVSVPPSALEFTLFEALSRAMTHLLAEKRALQTAWREGTQLSRSYDVLTASGEMSVELSIGIEPPAIQKDLLSISSMDPLFPPLDDSEEGESMRLAIQQTLLSEFARAPESKKLDGLFSSDLIMELAITYFNKTLGQLDGKSLREIVFTLVPRKVAMPPSEARAFLTELRAFYRFLKREFELEQADTCLRVLGGSAVKKLEAELANNENFGPGKMIMEAGAQAGFDMQSPGGLDGGDRWPAAFAQ